MDISKTRPELTVGTDLKLTPLDILISRHNNRHWRSLCYQKESMEKFLSWKFNSDIKINELTDRVMKEGKTLTVGTLSSTYYISEVWDYGFYEITEQFINDVPGLRMSIDARLTTPPEHGSISLRGRTVSGGSKKKNGKPPANIFSPLDSRFDKYGKKDR